MSSIVAATAVVSVPVVDETTLLADVALKGPTPMPLPMQLATPETVLLDHPAVVSAEREAAARWSEIAVTRAHRLQRVGRRAALAGNWLQDFSASAVFEISSLRGTLPGPLSDGGARTAGGAGSQALYRETVTKSRATVRAEA